MIVLELALMRQAHSAQHSGDGALAWSENERPFLAESSLLILPSIQVPMDKVQLKRSSDKQIEDYQAELETKRQTRSKKKQAG